MDKETPRQKARARRSAGQKIQGAVASRQQAEDDILRGQTPVRAENAEKLLNIGKDQEK